jgi:hypothetical protein
MLIIVDFPFALLMPIRRVNNYVMDDFDCNMIIVIISCEYKLIFKDHVFLLVLFVHMQQQTEPALMVMRLQPYATH